MNRFKDALHSTKEKYGPLPQDPECYISFFSRSDSNSKTEVQKRSFYSQSPVGDSTSAVRVTVLNSKLTLGKSNCDITWSDRELGEQHASINIDEQSGEATFEVHPEKHGYVVYNLGEKAQHEKIEFSDKKVLPDACAVLIGRKGWLTLLPYIPKAIMLRCKDDNRLVYCSHKVPKCYIGRTEDEQYNILGNGNDLAFDDDTVETTHAVISLIDNGGFAIKDLRSKAGTFINGVRVHAFTMVILSPGMEIHIGDPKHGNSFVVCFLKEKFQSSDLSLNVSTLSSAQATAASTAAPSPCNSLRLHPKTKVSCSLSAHIYDSDHEEED